MLGAVRNQISYMSCSPDMLLIMLGHLYKIIMSMKPDKEGNIPLQCYPGAGSGLWGLMLTHTTAKRVGSHWCQMIWGRTSHYKILQDAFPKYLQVCLCAL